MSETSESNNSETADKLVEKYMVQYGFHTHRSQITHCIDGLKPVTRRILLVVDHRKERKVSVLTGSVMEKYHPYGDSSISGAMVNMAKPYKSRLNLLSSGSNVGDYSGSVAAAPRYLPVKRSDFAEDVYFRGIDFDVFDYVPDEIGMGLEPNYLIPKLPMALLNSNFGIAIGYRSSPFTLNLRDVCSMIEHYIKLRKQYNREVPNQVLYNELAKYTLPDFPFKLLLVNKNDVLKSYKENNYRTAVRFAGTMMVTESSIVITSLPPGIVPYDLWMAVGTQHNSKKPNFFNKNFSRIMDMSKSENSCHIEFVLKRGVDPFSILSEFMHSIEFIRPKTPFYMFHTIEGRIKEMNPVDVLIEWYTARANSIRAATRLFQKKASKRIQEITAQLLILDDVDKAVAIIKASKTTDEAICGLRDNFDMTYTQASIITKITLSKLVNAEMDALEEELDSIAIEMGEAKRKFFHVDEVILGDCETILKKYKDECVRNVDKIKPTGYAVFKHGAILTEHKNELYDITERFTTPFMYYNHYGTRLVVMSQRANKYFLQIDPALKYIECNGVYQLKGQAIRIADLYNGKVKLHKGASVTIKKDHQYNPVGSSFTVVDRRGVISVVSYEDTNKLRDIVHISTNDTKEGIVAYSYDKNIIHITRFNDGDSLKFIPAIRNTTVIGIYPNHEKGDLIVAIPQSCLTRCGIRHIAMKYQDLDNKPITIKVSSRVQDGFKSTKTSSILKLTK